MMKELMVQKKTGFTLVELLIVIVVIALLVSIVVVAYNSITRRAIHSAAQASVQQADNKIKFFAAEHDDFYPDTLSLIGIIDSGDTTYDYVVNNTSTPRTYCIQASVSGVSYLSGYNQQTATWSHIPVQGTCRDSWLAHAVVTDVALAREFQCVINKAGKLYCWGTGGAHIGNNSSSTSNISTPAAVDTSGVLAGKTIKSVSVAGDASDGITRHTCAIASDDKAYCWGTNVGGSLGTGDTTPRLVPTQIDMTGALAGKTIKALSTGQKHTCVIASDDKAYCWGDNSDGQLGIGSKVASLLPVAVNTTGVLSGKTIKKITAGPLSTCVIASDDKAYCWGDGRGVGHGSTGDAINPTAVNASGALSGKTIKDIQSSLNVACAIASDNKVYCWGSNSSGQLGDGSTTQSLYPVAVVSTGALSGKEPTKLVLNAPNMYDTTTACVISADERAYCWGMTQSSAYAVEPQSVNLSSSTGELSLKRFTVRRSGYSLGIASDGQLYSWASSVAAPVLVTLPTW